MPRILRTMMRVPRITGFPLHTPGLISMRSMTNIFSIAHLRVVFRRDSAGAFRRRWFGMSGPGPVEAEPGGQVEARISLYCGGTAPLPWPFASSANFDHPVAARESPAKRSHVSSAADGIAPVGSILPEPSHGRPRLGRRPWPPVRLAILAGLAMPDFTRSRRMWRTEPRLPLLAVGTLD